MAEFISQAAVPSTTPRTLERTAFLGHLDDRLTDIITRYFQDNPGGTQVTLQVLLELGKADVETLAASHGRTSDETKQCIGLRVPILLVRQFGEAAVSTHRDPETRKASTRARSANWPTLDWVSRYTPHQVSTFATSRSAESAARKENP
jgi:hypothetical protein